MRKQRGLGVLNEQLSVSHKTIPNFVGSISPSRKGAPYGLVRDAASTNLLWDGEIFGAVRERVHTVMFARSAGSIEVSIRRTTTIFG
jgi:hypothetical protein